MERDGRDLGRWVWVLLAVMFAVAVVAEQLGWTRDVGQHEEAARWRTRIPGMIG